MEQTISALCKLSHKQFRAMLKKFRRKKKRQQLAKEREQQELLDQQMKESSPGYKEREEELRRNIALYDQFEERERIQLNKLWLSREEQAQIEFRRKQQRLEIEKIEREEERKRIVAEFEKQQYVENKVLEETQKVKSQKEVVTSDQIFQFCIILSSTYRESCRLHSQILQRFCDTLFARSNKPRLAQFYSLAKSGDDGPWCNPVAPENYNVGKEREQCMFFSKTGCCRFGDRCSRGHTRPDISCTILIRGMYSHFSIDQTGRDDYDTDMALEYEDKERYQHFKTFYNDVVPEFKKFGKVVQFKVCNNFEPHLRGNVYVQFARNEEAVEAYKNFNGRYYAGKQITCEFTHVIRWRSAICGLHDRSLCPKGMNCNFLHVFKNPKNEFWEANRDLPARGKSQNYHSFRRRDSERSDYFNEHRYHKYESKSDRNDYRDERLESKSDRRESRSERHESRSERHESRSERHESRSERRESRSDRHDSRSSESSTDSLEESEHHSSRSKTFKNGDDHSSHDKKRRRNSRSRSNSPSEVSSERKSSHKKRKHKKKKSRKNKRQDDSINS